MKINEGIWKTFSVMLSEKKKKTKIQSHYVHSDLNHVKIL